MENSFRTVCLSVPAEPDWLEMIGYPLYGIASRIGFTYGQIEDMKVIVGSVCDQAVLKACPGGGRRKIDIWFRIVNSGLQIQIVDSGNTRETAKDRVVMLSRWFEPFSPSGPSMKLKRGRL